MSGASKKLMGTTAAGDQLLAIEDVFSTYLYTGTGSALTITNGIDLAGEGGLVWLKNRGTVSNHSLHDTERTPSYQLVSNSTAAEDTLYGDLSSFNSDGFSLGTGGGGNNIANTSKITSWTFRKAPRFFDVVTYTGNGVAGRTISHDLGVEPGMIIVKGTSNAGSWQVYHREITDTPETKYMNLDSTNSFSISSSRWNNTAPTDSVFTLGNDTSVNANGYTYVAYLFAHDPLGPSEDGSDGLIACGSYTGNGSSNGPEIDLGWEPQWLLVKNASASANWTLLDVMRGFPVSGSNQHTLLADSSTAELVNTSYQIQPLSDGFQPVSTNGLVNASGNTYIYIAIRRGPMRAPTSGTEVFDAISTTTNMTAGNSYDFGFPVDLFFGRGVATAGNGGAITPRITSKTLFTTATSAELSSSYFGFDSNTVVKTTTTFDNDTDTYQYYGWRRAPGFFDVVAYTGDGVAGRTVPHNLGVAPEMMIIKGRNYITDWAAYHSAIGNTKYLIPNTTAAAATGSLWWNNTSPTADIFTLGNSSRVNNTSSNTYIAYLFATLPGVSKVGSYTGNGSSQTINCGFTSGARFVLIKRTDSTGDWYVWDTARGIVTGNDPHLSLNTTAAEVTTNDSIDPASSGFIVNQVAATNINVNAASYIFYSVS